MTLVPTLFPGARHSRETGPLAKIAIVGRGFTGIMTAIALLKGFERPFHLVMFDPQPKIDGGEDVNQSVTLLNSRVRDLSVNPDRRDDFRQWLETDEAARQRLDAVNENVDHAFVPGEIFSAYVYQRFSEALRRRPDVVVQVCPESVTAIDRHPQSAFTVVSSDQKRTVFDAVFLATGYGLREAASEAQALSAVRNAVVVGGGVHAVDRALRLLAAGEASHVTLISASGFLPQSHARAAVGPITPELPLPNTLRGAFRSLREAANIANAEGSGWQGIMNGFRLRARDLWQGLTPDERGRFKRHVKAIYDSHRNRLPPEHYQRLHAAIASGAITLRKSKVERIATNGVLLSSPTGLEVLPSDRTINCRLRPNDIDSPLFRSLLRTGLARRDEVELGILVDRCGRALAAPDRFQGLFAMGPLGLGSLPDIDLVPEIVLQSHAAASALGAWIDELAANASSARSSG
ncbi:FAD/NAD(P)-binding protein [Pararhizobium sp.]|uniref:FAD/NAD(P)-binding protein n=1 Tax=Pararhizobium sp. TaxID=1977563 RepID=UPI002717CD94|nr:FAD/NAD(P)-binding protein [Pararhizobium sp.]MDO9416698.1 FAD/NAD(P)-binding protein [Pararhizobium sp.]